MKDSASAAATARAEWERDAKAEDDADCRFDSIATGAEQRVLCSSLLVVVTWVVSCD